MTNLDPYVGGGGVRPVGTLGQRFQEHGRIRFGIEVPTKDGTKTRPKAIDTWRFTSPDQAAIVALADLYGGTARPWTNPKANPQHQFEVITQASSIRVMLPPSALSIWYELWSGAGCQRRCDGVTCAVLTSDPNEPMKQVDCLCKQRHLMECKPKTRLHVLLPEIRMAGLWRMETGSWNAAEELPAMERMLAIMQTIGVLEAQLVLTQRSEEGGRKQYVVPRLEFSQTTQELIDGMATVAGGTPTSLAAPPTAMALPAPADPWMDGGGGGDDEVVDGEIVDDDDEPAAERLTERVEQIHQKADEAKPKQPGAQRRKMHALITEAAHRHDLDPDEVRHALVRAMTKGATTSSNDLRPDDVSRLIDYMNEVIDGTRGMTLEGDEIALPKQE